MSTGYITVKVFTADKAMPVPKAQIRIVDLRIALDQTIYSDSYGNAERIKVFAPDKATSLKPQDSIPYETYNIEVMKDGYIPTVINHVPVFAGETCLQPVAMIPQPEGHNFANLVNNIEIPPNGLQLKIEKRPLAQVPGSQPQIKQVVIPDFIRVHLGDPDSNDKTILVPFCDYIKNVTSCEIYATWPKESLVANILAIISFALNRIYTGFYPAQGKDFDITSMPDRDPYFCDGRNIYENISDLVDGVFNTYIKRIGFNEPLLANYCNGITNRCEGISQWGSVTLANQGQSAEDILKYYYGNVQTETAKDIKGVDKEIPDGPLRLGDVGEHVMTLQKHLNQIGKSYKNIPNIPKENGNYDAYTQDAVRAFQKQFSLIPDGIAGKKTWCQIAFVNNAVQRLLGLSQARQNTTVPQTAPGTTLREGSTGGDVRLLQYLLNSIGVFYNSVLPVEITGTYDKSTANAVKSFQKTFSVQQTGIVDKNTWNALLNVYKGIEKQIKAVLDNFESLGEETGYNDMAQPGTAKTETARTTPPEQFKAGGPRARMEDMSAKQPGGDQNRRESEERIRAAMNYANMEYKMPPRGTMNMAYSSDIKDYVPESSMDRGYPDMQKYQPKMQEKTETETPAPKKGAGETGSMPARDVREGQPGAAQKTGYKPTEGQKFPYTPWMTEPQTGKTPAGQDGAERKNMYGYESEKPETHKEGQKSETEMPGVMRGDKQTKPWMAKEETIPAAYELDSLDRGMPFPYIPRVEEDHSITRPGTSISRQSGTMRKPGMETKEQRPDMGAERRDYEPEMYPGAPVRPGTQAYPHRMPGAMNAGMPPAGAVPPDEDVNDAYSCPAPPVANPVYPNTALKIGSKGKNVQLMQEYLSYIALSLMRYKLVTNELKVVVNDGNYGIDTTDAVIRFQNRYEMPVNGVIDAATWSKIVEVYNNPCE